MKRQNNLTHTSQDLAAVVSHSTNADLAGGGFNQKNVMSVKQRYTGKCLENDVELFNERLASKNHKMRFVVGYRNNYTAVDLATPENAARHCTNRNLECGSPEECLNACYRYLANIN